MMLIFFYIINFLFLIFFIFFLFFFKVSDDNNDNTSDYKKFDNIDASNSQCWGILQSINPKFQTIHLNKTQFNKECIIGRSKNCNIR